MLHLAKISRNGKEFNLIASGALAFKVFNKILKDPVFLTCDISVTSMLHTSIEDGQPKAKLFDGKKLFYVIISDLDKISNEALCRRIMESRQQESYAVCDVISMSYNERYYKALKRLRNSFDEMVELNKIALTQNRSLSYSDHQNYMITDFALMHARMMFHIATSEFVKTSKSTEKATNFMEVG
jgi:hypothetical protein